MKNAISNISLTEQRFRDFMSEFACGCERYENGNKLLIYTLNKGTDNKFNLSYHLEFPQKNVQFNFWFAKISYLNSKESVTISIYNRNELLEKNKLKNILTANDLKELKIKVNEIFTKYRSLK